MIQTVPQPRSQSANPYLERFEQFERSGFNEAPSWIFPIRKAAISRFVERGFPTTNDEDWRYTNVAPIAKLPFRPVIELSSERANSSIIDNVAFAKIESHRLVFLNGVYSEELSSIPALTKGIRLGSLAAALAENAPVLENIFTRRASDHKNSFADLNTAFFQDGAFIYLPAGANLEKPIHLVFINSPLEFGSTSQPRNLIVMERGSRATVLEAYVGAPGPSSLTNAVTDLILGEDSSLEHCKFQDEHSEAFHIAAIHAELGRNCRFTSHSIVTGARLSRNNIKTVLNGEGVECILNGLYLTKDQQLADHHMIVEHVKPHCNSHEYFNGILEDRSRGVFHGRIFVHPEAQKTDAKQTNKNLLLSDNATIDTKPQLEIYADDVKCTHGATVGQLNEESIFYLRARGIGMDTARRMLIHAFAGEIIDRVRYRPAREELDAIVWSRLEQSPEVAEVR